MSTGVSVVFSTALSTLLFGTALTGQFTVGAFLILTAVYLFSNPLPARFLSSGKKSGQTEMKNLLPK